MYAGNEMLPDTCPLLPAVFSGSPPPQGTHLPDGMHWKMARWPATTVMFCGCDRRGGGGEGGDPAREKEWRNRESETSSPH